MMRIPEALQSTQKRKIPSRLSIKIKSGGSQSSLSFPRLREALGLHWWLTPGVYETSWCDSHCQTPVHTRSACSKIDQGRQARHGLSKLQAMVKHPEVVQLSGHLTG